MFTISLVIVIITSIISYQAFNDRVLMDKLILNPYSVKKYKQWYRLFTCALIHADWPHLIFNMVALWSFGGAVEFYYKYEFGTLAIPFYIFLYIGAQLVSVFPTYIKYKDFMAYNSLGASGAVSAIVFASILFNPWGMIFIFFIKVPGIIFGIIYLGYTHYMSKRGGDNINHDAHFFGALFGILFTILLKPDIALQFIDNLLTPQL